MNCGLIGRRLDYSFSPAIHQALGQKNYTLHPLQAHDLKNFFDSTDLAGFNVTNPYKQAVMPYLHELDDIARRTMAVNTVVCREGRFYGYNTDVEGLYQALAYRDISLTDQHVLILGNGATSRTVMEVCRQCEASAVARVSRRGDTEFAYDSMYEAVETTVLVNATPLGTVGEPESYPVDFSRFPHLKVVLDVVYHPLRTDLLCRAEQSGLRIMNGLDMLIFQAAASECLFGNKVSSEQVQLVCESFLADKENLVLIGMPSSGKTTLGRRLAEQLGRPFYDTDRQIERITGRLCRDILSQDGEAAFRAIEKQVLLECSQQTGCVIATGGGSVLCEEGMTALRRNGRLYFLEAYLEQLHPQGDRPLSSDRAKLRHIYDERMPLYRRYAQVVVPQKNAFEQIIGDFQR